MKRILITLLVIILLTSCGAQQDELGYKQLLKDKTKLIEEIIAMKDIYLITLNNKRINICLYCLSLRCFRPIRQRV